MRPRLNRRRASKALAGLAMPMLSHAAQEPELLRLAPNGEMPNNQRLPVLLYRSVLSTPSSDLTEALEKLLAKNGWTPQWRNGVYPFHHYHSTAHEALAFSRGEAKLLLGGALPGGREVIVRANDVALLPCGTGHCLVSASRDFLVVGAYALGQNWDLCRSAPDAVARERMRALPFPASDPVSGTQGALVRHWKTTSI